MLTSFEFLFEASFASVSRMLTKCNLVPRRGQFVVELMSPEYMPVIHVCWRWHRGKEGGRSLVVPCPDYGDSTIVADPHVVDLYLNDQRSSVALVGCQMSGVKSHGKVWRGSGSVAGE